MKNLKDKWVLITGGARGLGKALAYEFLKKGSHLILVDIDRKNLEKTTQTMETKGGKVISLFCDMNNLEEVRNLAKTVLQKAGQIDVLVNNAGIFFLSSMVDTSWEDWEKMLNINLHGPILLAKELAPQMIKRKEGHIVNISSVAGLVGGGGYSTYGVCKFGLVGFSESIRIELASYGVGVTVVCPGFIRTSLIEHMEIKGFHESRFKEYPSFITMKPSVAARKIVKSVQKNKRRLVLTCFGKMLCTLFYWFPYLGEKISLLAYKTVKSK